MRNSTLACVFGAATLGGALFASSPVEAQTLACGGTYTIQAIGTSPTCSVDAVRPWSW